ncbi:DUF4129 domain-containing protein [Actinoplanes regularis]|uniref:DUF4129 domain-containing protein n=1 Tax=Actinoplanes regularis TaxID=52697 RepID=UPI0024A3C05E|nr:DUF4129 domain-containing protein [Actinoplanes regularis]GLW31094.1 hypothetical protein Areg01_40340 [Actinoplanes regularis]
MTRTYDELVGKLFDLLSAQTVLLILIAVTGLVATLWYWFPAWVPRQLPRWRLRRLRMPRLRFRFPRFRFPRLRFPRLRIDWRRLLRRRRKPKAGKEPAAVVPEPVVADLEPVGPRESLSLADRLAAEGRYAEAIRERLRETVVALTRAGVITPQPGTTPAELTVDASARRPAVGAPLGGATEIFSEIWYGRREASSGHDDRMRTLTAEIRAALTRPQGGPR